MVIFDRPVFYIFGCLDSVRLKLIGKRDIFGFRKKVIWRRKLISNPFSTIWATLKNWATLVRYWVSF